MELLIAFAYVASFFTIIVFIGILILIGFAVMAEIKHLMSKNANSPF